MSKILCIDCEKDITNEEIKYNCNCYKCSSKNIFTNDFTEKNDTTFICIDCVCEFFRTEYIFYLENSMIVAKLHKSNTFSELEYLSESSQEYVSDELKEIITDTGTHYTRWVYSSDYDNSD